MWQSFFYSGLSFLDWRNVVVLCSRINTEFHDFISSKRYHPTVDFFYSNDERNRTARTYTRFLEIFPTFNVNKMSVIWASRESTYVDAEKLLQCNFTVRHLRIQCRLRDDTEYFWQLLLAKLSQTLKSISFEPRGGLIQVQRRINFMGPKTVFPNVCDVQWSIHFGSWQVSRVTFPNLKHLTFGIPYFHRTDVNFLLFCEVESIFKNWTNLTVTLLDKKANVDDYLSLYPLWSHTKDLNGMYSFYF